MHPYYIHTVIKKAWLLLLLCSPLALKGGDIYWNLNTNGNWDVNANWSPATAPGSNDGAFFTNRAASSITVTLAAGNTQLKAIDFNATNAYAIAGGATSALLLNVAGTNFSYNNSGNVTIDVPIVNKQDSIWAGNGSGLLTVNGAVSMGNSGRTLTKQGSFTLVLTNDNNFGGGLIIEGGTVIGKGQNNAFGVQPITLKGGTGVLDGITTPTTATWSMQGGSVTSSNSAAGIAGTVALVSNTTFTTLSDLNISGAISGSGGLTKVGAAILTLSGTAANTYTGLTTINEGTLILNKTAGVNAIAGNLQASNSTVQLNAANQIADTSSVSLFQNTFFKLNGFNESVAGLNISGNNVTIDFGTTGSSILMASSFNLGTFNLNIFNWTGSATQTGLTDQFKTTNYISFMTNRISFYSDAGTTLMGDGRTVSVPVAGGLYELIPIPEPSTLSIGLIFFLGLSAALRRRFKS